MVCQSSFFQVLELKTLDYRFLRLGEQGHADDRLVIVEIDETSVGNLAKLGVGAWPWPRDVYADFLRYLRNAGARLVVFDILFTEGRVGAEGQEQDQRFVDATAQNGNAIQAVFLGNESETPAEINGEAPEDEARRAAIEEAARQKQEILLKHSFPAEGQFPTFIQASFPFSGLALAARDLGHVAVIFDPDGPWRRYLPFARYRDRLIPSLALSTAILTEGLSLPDETALDPSRQDTGTRLEIRDREIRFGSMRVPLDSEWQLPIWYNGPPGTYPSQPFWKVFVSQLQIEEGSEPLIAPSTFKGKTVLVGVTAAGLHDIFTTPYSGTSEDSGFGKMSGVEVHTNVVDNLLHNRYLKEPPAWFGWMLTALLAASVLTLALRVRLWLAGLLGFVSAGAYLGLALAVFPMRWHLQAVPPILAWAMALGSGLAYQYWGEGADKRKVKEIFSKYVSRDVFQQLMTNPDATALGGKRAEITVLFSDLRGFTSMSENRTPEAVISQLNEYFSGMVELVFQHQGTIDKFVGDMIMALFSTPLHDPDHADHAVQCAVAMQRRLVEMNQDWERRGQPQLHCGVGINSGDMVAGNLGAESIRSYTVIGDNVNLGARLESLCKEYKSDIIISEFTLALLKSDYPRQELGDVLVKGKHKPVKIFRVFWEPGAVSLPKLEQ